MLPGEFTGLFYLPVSPDQNPMIPLPNFNNMVTNPTINPAYHLNTSFLTNNLPNYPPPQTTSSLSNNSTSDEAEEITYHHHDQNHQHLDPDEQLRIIDERRQRRMISNRESARRSRMRKQKHLDELWSQVLRLRTENHSLIDKLNHVSESHDKVLQENARLKEEASDLRQMLTDLQIGSPYNAAVLRAPDDDDDDDDHVDKVVLEDHHHHHHHEIIIPCNAAHLRAGTSSTNIATSVDLLH